MIQIEQKDTAQIIKVIIGVFILLGLFLVTKTVTEVFSWNSNDTYPTRTFSVSAEGEIFAVADIATFSFGVNEEGITSEEAQALASAKINSAIEFLKNSGVDEKDIKTESYSIFPKYQFTAPCFGVGCPPQTSEIVGYTVSHFIKVKVRDIDNTGKFLSELTTLGINNVSGISFTIDDEEILYEQARAEAIESAKQKAHNLAKELGVKVGKIISFSEDGPIGHSHEYGYGGDMMLRSSVAEPQIPMGENIYRARVYITYEIK